MAKTKLRTFQLGEITSAGQTLSAELKITDTKADAITAICLNSTVPIQAQGRGRIRIELSGEIIFDDMTPAKLILIGGNNVMPDERLYTRMGEIPVNNGILLIRYTDEETPAVAYETHKLTLILEYKLS